MTFTEAFHRSDDMTFTVGQQVTDIEAASLPDGAKYTWTLTEHYEIRDGAASYLGRQQNPTTRTVTFLPLDPEPPVGSVWRNEYGRIFEREPGRWIAYAVNVASAWADLNERGGTLIYRAEETT